MKNEKEIKGEMKRLGIKSDEQLLGILRNMSELEVLSHDDSNVGVIVIGNRNMVGDNPSELLELLEVSHKVRRKLDSKLATILSYTVGNEMLKSIKEKLDKDFSKVESELDAKIKNTVR